MTHATRLFAWSAVVVAGLFVGLLGCQRISAVDYWWQLQTGADVVRHGPPRTETYSFTAAGSERVEVRWGYCAALWAVVHTLGPAMATVLKILGVVTTFGLATWAGTRRLQSVRAAAVVTIAAIGASQRFVVRPEMVTYVLLAAFLCIVARQQERASRWAWLLPGLQVVWTNAHGLFVLGPAIVGAWLVAEGIEGLIAHDLRSMERRGRLRRIGLLLAATLAATLVNPYGPRVVAIALAQFGVLHRSAQKEFFTELQSPFAFGQQFTAIRSYEVLLGLAAVSCLLALRRQRAFWIIVTVALGALSLTAIRNVPLFCIVAVPFVLRNVESSSFLARPSLRRFAQPAQAGLAVATIATALFYGRAIVTDRFWIDQHGINQFGLGIATRVFPAGAVDFLERTGEPGAVLTSEATGSYLIGRGHRVFFDPRGDVYTDAFIATFRDLLTVPTSEKLAALTKQYNLRAAVIEPDAPALVEHLMRDPEWRLVYLDSEGAVFLQRDASPQVPSLDLAQNGGTWLRELRTRSLPPPRAAASLGFWSRVTNPTPYARLARIFFERQQYDLARPLYEDALAAAPRSFMGWGPLGAMAAARHDWQAAVQAYERAVALEPRDAELRARTGLACLQVGRSDDAARHATAALALAPQNPSYQALLGTIELKRGHGAEAARWLEAAQAGRPDDAAVLRNLAMAQFILGKTDVARSWLDKALALDPNDAQAQALARKLGGRP